MERTNVGLIQRWLFTGTRWLRWLYPKAIWRLPVQDNVVYLTFDDGPIPEVTPFVLAQLAEFQAKATFFVIGDNVGRYPDIFQSILDQGHAVGNHTENHLKGTRTADDDYIQNIHQCQQRLPANSRWFRPPYGRLTFRQYHRLRQTYHIFFWDVLSQDYDDRLSPQVCLDETLNAIRPGSIVVFHDSLKAWPRLSYVLPRFLAAASARGYRFEIPPVPYTFHQ